MKTFKIPTYACWTGELAPDKTKVVLSPEYIRTMHLADHAMMAITFGSGSQLLERLVALAEPSERSALITLYTQKLSFEVGNNGTLIIRN